MVDIQKQGFIIHEDLKNQGIVEVGNFDIKKLIQKQCIIINTESRIQERVRHLHFDENGKCHDFLKNQEFVEVGNFDIKKFDLGLWKYNGTDFDELESGSFYLKTDGTFADLIEKDKSNEYTNIIPLQKFEDGTTQVFNEALNAWEYTFKGSELIELEKKQQLETARIEKLTELGTAFANSKRIIIKNGITLEINNRNVFLAQLNEVKVIDSNSDVVKSYQQIDGIKKKVYSLSSVPAILKKVYEGYFVTTTATGFVEATSSYNKKREIKYRFAIEQAETIDKLNGIALAFDKPNGVEIPINETAAEILKDKGITEAVKDLIKKQTDKDGNIHLITVEDIETVYV